MSALRRIKDFLKTKVLGDLPGKLVGRWLERELGDKKVLTGPFKGMQYGERASSSPLVSASAYYPKLLGTYELEIAPWIQKFCGAGLDLIVDVGAAEGYYAVGLALQTQARVIAFEADGTEMMMKMSSLNGVGDRITPNGFCDEQGLRNALLGGERVGVIMDIEGGEAVLLDPEVVPALATATILVEVHDCFVPGTTDLLKSRFEATHRIENIDSRLRSPADMPLRYEPGWFDPSWYYLSYLGERPFIMNWLYMEPKVISLGMDVVMDSSSVHL